MSQKIKINYGPQAIIKAYKKTLKSKSVDFICLSNNYTTIIGDYFDKEFVKKVKSKGIKTREILPDTIGNRESVKHKNLKLNLVRFIKTKTNSESDMILYENKALLVSFDPLQPIVLEISDKNLVKNFKTLFESLWCSGN